MLMMMTQTSTLRSLKNPRVRDRVYLSISP